MVRLKVDENNQILGGNKISIPYGAIKRNYQMTSYATNNLISIPYGAIKSQCPFFMISLKLYHFNSLWCD